MKKIYKINVYGLGVEFTLGSLNKQQFETLKGLKEIDELSAENYKDATGKNLEEPLVFYELSDLVSEFGPIKDDILVEVVEAEKDGRVYKEKGEVLFSNDSSENPDYKIPSISVFNQELTQEKQEELEAKGCEGYFSCANYERGTFNSSILELEEGEEFDYKNLYIKGVGIPSEFIDSSVVLSFLYIREKDAIEMTKKIMLEVEEIEEEEINVSDVSEVHDYFKYEYEGEDAINKYIKEFELEEEDSEYCTAGKGMGIVLLDKKFKQVH